MSELSNRMTKDMQLAGLVEGTRREYLRAPRQLATYYMVWRSCHQEETSFQGRSQDPGDVVVHYVYRDRVDRLWQCGARGKPACRPGGRAARGGRLLCFDMQIPICFI